MESLPNYLMNTEDLDSNIYETSFVENPASGFSFLKFNAQSGVKTLEFKQVEINGYKRMASGAWFMPDTKYLRYDAQRGYYTVEFTKDSLKDALLKYLKCDYANKIKVEHDGDFRSGFISMEHWIYEDENTKSPIFGLTAADLGYNPTDLKVGTVLKTVYISDEKFWNEEVLSGKVNGFSIGGLFTLEEEKSLGTMNFADVELSTPAVEVQSESVEAIPEVQSDNAGEVIIEEEATSEIINEVVEQTVEENVVSEEEILNDRFSHLEKVLSEKFETSLKGLQEAYLEKTNALSSELQQKQSDLESLNTILSDKDKQIEMLKETKKDSPITTESRTSKTGIAITGFR